jgi:hypothetical protein
MKYLITILLFSVVTLTSSAQTKEPLACKGVTKSGVACKSTIVSKKTGYCNAHDPNRVKCTGKTTTGKPCMMVVLKGTTTCRFHNK